MNINISSRSIKLKGLNHIPYTLFNTSNSNFKAISLPKSNLPILYSGSGGRLPRI
jgi:hypothetical protein